MVQPFESRFVHQEGVDGGQKVFLLERTEDDPNVWYGMASKGVFGTVNLRQWRYVRREKEDLGLGVLREYEELPDPGDEEKQAILDMYREWKGNQVAAPEVAGARPGPGTPRFDGSSRGRDFAARGALAGRRPDGGGGRGNSEGGRRRRRWYGRAWERSRELGAGQLGAGIVCTGGGFWKFYASGSVWVTRILEFLEKNEHVGKSFKKALSRGGYVKERIFQSFEYFMEGIGWCVENWDAVIFMAMGIYFLYSLYSGPASTAGQLSKFRDEEDGRDKEAMSLQRLQHRELMEELRKNRPSSSSGSGLGGSLLDAVGAHGQILAEDKSSQGGFLASAKRRATGVTETVRKLLRRARNPLQCALKILEKFREVPDWSMEALEGYTERLAKDYTADVYKNNTTARVRMTTFMRDHGNLEGCNAAKPLVAVADLQDAAVIEDGVDRIPELINTELYERLCRWGYGLELVFSECSKEEHWKDSKKLRTQWDLLPLYHPSDKRAGEVRAVSADLEVRDVLQQKATFAKYLSKNRGLAPDGSGG